MNKTNWIKRGALAAVMAGLVATATPGVALAAQVSADQATQTIVKNWTVASDAQYNKDEAFTFLLKYDHADKVGTNETATPTGIEEAGKTVQVKGLTKQGDTLVYTGSAKLSDLLAGVDFSKPGDYYFTLSEVKGDNANITYATNSYQVKVRVGWAEDLKTAKVDSVAIVDGEKKADTATFANGAKDNSALNVSKTVAGTAANTEDTFNYTLNVQGASGEYTVTLGDGTTAKLEAGKDFTFTLKHGQHISVANLPVGATYTVTEKDTDYTETNTVNGKASKDGLKAEGAITKDQNDVAYKNEKGFAPGTGITMNTLPFIGVAAVAVAGGATLVISRKRRAGEEF